MSAVQRAHHCRQTQNQTEKTHKLNNTGLKIRSTETNDIVLSERFKKWAKAYGLTDFEALSVFYYDHEKFQQLRCSYDEFFNGRARLVSALGSLNQITIKI